MSCIACGGPIDLGARFCTSCGVPTPNPSPAVATIAAPAAPAAYPGWIPPVPVPPLPRARVSFRDLPLATLFPVRSWLEEQGWWRSRLGLFGGFAIAPFALLQLTSDDGDISRAAWGFALYFGLAWLLAMHALIRPETPDRWVVGRVVAFTAVAGIAIAVALESWLGAEDDDLLTMIFKVGLPEEMAKALPVYLFVFLSHRVWTTRTYLFIGVVSGLTFGVTEAVMYTSMYDDVGLLLGESTTVVSIWRLLTGSMFHACLAGITAYFIGLAYWYRRASWPLMLAGLALTSVLHGVYNSTSSGWFGSLIAGGVVFMFLGYIRSGDEIALKLGESGIGR